MQTGIGKIITRASGAIGWVIFSNPEKHNAMSREMYLELAAALDGYANDASIRVVVLRGEGDKAFVSGGDISQFSVNRATLEGVRAGDLIMEQAYRALCLCPKPTIAMIGGYCMGAGVNLAVSCDVRFASEQARFAIPAAKLGVSYRHDALERLAALVGPAFTADLMYSGRQVDASEASRMGLLNRVLPAAELEPYVLDYAGTVAANAPLTIGAAKRALIEMRKAVDQRDRAACTRLEDACFASEDYREGRTAFAEKRKPVFTGR